MPGQFTSRFHLNVITIQRFNGITVTLALFIAALLPVQSVARGNLIYETTSPYHHIRVVDDLGLRTLYFDNAPESSMSVSNNAAGHFEYTEYFHMPWLWNTQICEVLMIGLGGGSTQHAFEQYYPDVSFRTVELDPTVARVARDYFNVRESEKQKVEISDGRVYLRRSRAKYDLIILDAYLSGRYGSSIPQHLATKEFFELAREHLTTNGVIAYNVAGTLTGWHSDITGAMYRTMKTVFPQVYLFPARSSWNVVFIATCSAVKANVEGARWRAAQMVQTGRMTMPAFRQRVEAFQANPPASAARSPVLTDDYAPVEGLSGGYGNPDRGR